MRLIVSSKKSWFQAAEAKYQIGVYDVMSFCHRNAKIALTSWLHFHKTIESHTDKLFVNTYVVYNLVYEMDYIE